MRFILAASLRSTLVGSLLVLAGCSSHKAQTANDPHTHAHGDVQLASTAAGGCHGMKAEKADLASSEGKQCSSKKVEMASSEGKQCSSKKVELASTEAGAAHCSAKKVELASTEAGAAHCSAKKAELAAVSADAHCGDCPKKADGSCDHEAGAKAGRECCKNHLAEATATP